MKAKEKIIHAFLTEGGKMGELIRSFDWEKTALGSPDTWPQSLRIAVRIILDCPFGMYIAWSKEYIQLYNDGYRPILGITKHPQALGISTRKTFEEIWPTIGPMFDGVMKGTPVGFPDFILHLDRNGFVEECVFDFSYSPIRLEDGEVGGVLVTVIETSEKVKAVKALNESLADVSLAKIAIQKSEENLRSTILQAPVAMCIFKGENFIVDLANDRMFELWGKPAKAVMNKPIFEGLPEAKDQGFEAILQGVYTTGKTYSADGVPITLPRKGVIELVYVNFVYAPYKESDGRISGILAVAIDVTAQLTASKKIEESEQALKRYKHMADNANEPFILMRKDGTFAYLNDLALQRWGYTKEEGQHIRVPDVDPIYDDETFNAAFAAAQIKKIPQFETLHKKKDGTVYPVEINMGGLSLEGRPHIFAIARDITERKKLEDAVRESEEKIRSFILQAPVAMCLYRGPQYIIEIVNEELLAIWDKSLESVINKSVFEALPAAKGQGFEDLLEKVYSTGEKFDTFGIPITLTRKGKPKTIYVNLVYQPYREADGSISGIVEVVSDVTEQVEARKKIEQSEFRFKLVLRNSSQIVFTQDINLKHTWIYNSLEGFDEATIIGKDDKELHEPKNAQILTDIKMQVLDTAQGINTEVMLTIDGQQIYYDLLIEPIKNDEGKVEGISGVALNITEKVIARKKIEASENQFRTFADSIQNLAWIANGDGWIYWYNQQWYDYTGTTIDEMEGWGWQKVHHPDHVERILELTKKLWKKDEAFELTFPLRRHDGVYRWFLTRAYPIKDASGNIERWIGTNTDITEQKSFTEELERKVAERTEELKEKNLYLELINAELKSFSYIASHDLKEPLRKIQAFSKRIIETETFSDKTQDYFNRIISAGERMQNLIDSLLDFSRANTIELIFEPCDLNTLVEESKNDLHISIIENQATIQYESLPVITGVYIQISQLITNLLENAIKYSRPEIKPLIKITSSIIEGRIIDHTLANQQTKYHAIQFEDNGIGFEQEYANKIFELFQRLHGKNEYSGTGIGLGIVKKIATNHNGFITAKGKPNVGSTFTLYIPTA